MVAMRVNRAAPETSLNSRVGRENMPGGGEQGEEEGRGGIQWIHGTSDTRTSWAPGIPL